MEEYKKALEEIDKHLSLVQVSGDSVMFLAMARQKLKDTYNQLELVKE